MINRTRHRHTPGADVRDRGTALPLVLVLSVILAVLVTSISTYAATNLRYGGITADRSDRLSAADAGMRYAIDQLKLRNAACIIDTTVAELPAADVDFNGATAKITCQRISGGEEAIQAWAAVLTGENLNPSNSNHFLISTQGGNSEPKILGGPVYMSRVNANAFDIGPELRIENGSLYYFDNNNCATPVTKASLPAGLKFIPDFIYGPICIRRPWTERFVSPVVPAHLADQTFPVRFGDMPLNLADPASQGSYTQQGNCRVFRPGRYVTPPDLGNEDAYFQTGDYLFDLPDANAQIIVEKGTVTAGRINPVTTDPPIAEIPPINDCLTAQNADPAPPGDYGASFFMAGRSHIRILTQGSLEIHGRQQGNSFVSIQALCNPSLVWCTNSVTPFGQTAPLASSLTAPASSSSNATNPNIVYTASGNNRELVAHGIVYAPLAQMEFGNVTNTAIQKLLGGLVLSRLLLQSSASATNFEIAVPTSPIDAEIELTSTSVKNGETSIRAIVEYRPYEEDIDERIRVNSWRVCETSSCT
jgi:hypothetical protein